MHCTMNYKIRLVVDETKTYVMVCMNCMSACLVNFLCEDMNYEYVCEYMWLSL